MDNKDRMENREPAGDPKDSSLSPYIDPFTQAYNRFFLYQFFPQKLKDALDEDYKIALFMIDLDNFKHINDTYGHLVGDKVIKKISETLKKSLRDSDYLIRYAGDEFVAVLSVDSLETSYRIAERIIANIRGFKLPLDGQEIIQTISMGFAIFPDDAGELEVLIQRADQALYFAKRRGKNNFSYFKDVNINQISLKIAIDSFPCKRFIGREEEFSLIKKKIREVRTSGSIGGIVVFGESGIGKSRILEESSRISQDLGMQALSFNPRQKNSLTPYCLLTKTIDSCIKNKLLYDKETTFVVLNKIQEQSRNVLSHFIPSIREIFPAQGEVPRDNGIIFNSFLSLIETILEGSLGLFWGWDNIQYSDIPSLDFLNFLLNRRPDLKMFIFLAILEPIPPDIYNPSAMRGVIEKLRFSPNLEFIKLDPFPKDKLRQMVGVIFPGIEPSEDFIQRVFEVTKGNLFFIEELLRFLLEKSFIYFENERWKIGPVKKEILPASLQEVVRQRLDSLDPAVKETILISSVIGEDINPDLLSRVKAAEEGDILEILDKVRKLKIIKEGENGFDFLNDAVKEATLKEIPVSQRKDIYSKVSDALMNVYRDNIETVSFQLANIFDKTEDLERLNKFSKIITERTSRILNPQEILKYLEDLTETTEQDRQIAAAVEIDIGKIQPAIDFLRQFQGALKDFKLYPEGSKIRTSIMEEVYGSLGKILENYEVINISEVEKSLVLNKRRITPRLAKTVDVDNIVKFLIDRDIKSISLIKGLTKKELNDFFEIIALDPEQIYMRGEWKSILSKNELRHISVNKAVYTAPDRRTPLGSLKDHLGSSMMLDFILGKISGKDLRNIDLASAFKDSPGSFSGYLSKAAREAKGLDKHTDEVDVLYQGMQRLSEIAQEMFKDIPDTKKRDRAVNEKIANVFMGFDAKTKSHLIRKAASRDEPVSIVLRGLGEDALRKLIEDIFSSGGSLWNLRRLVSKLYDIFGDSEESLHNILPQALVNNIPAEKQKNFIEGNTQWGDLDLQEKTDDVLKMSVQDLEDIPEDSLSSVIEAMIKSREHGKFGDLFDYLKRKSLESPEKLAPKIKHIFINSLKNVYALAGDDNKTAFKILEDMLAGIEGTISKEDLEFILGLMADLSKELNLCSFKRKGEFDKIGILRQICKIIDDNSAVIGKDGISFWKKKFNFESLAIDLFNAYLNGIIPTQDTEEAQEDINYFLLSFSDKIIESLSEVSSGTTDPFEKFVLLKRLKSFIFSLKGDALREFITGIFVTMQFDDACDIMLCVRKEELSSVLENLYSRGDDAGREKIIDIIDRLNLKEARSFLGSLLKQDNPFNLKKKITRVYGKIEGR